MRVIPGMTVLVPADANETYNALDAAVTYQGPVYLRLSRLASTVLEEQPFEIGKANILRDGKDVALFCCGLMVEQCLEAAKLLESHGISAAVINVHTIKPLDEKTVRAYAAKCGRVVTVEEHSTIGGLGDAVASAICGMGGFRFRKIGVEDCFGQSGTAEALLEEYGLTAPQIASVVERL